MHLHQPPTYRVLPINTSITCSCVNSPNNPSQMDFFKSVFSDPTPSPSPPSSPTSSSSPRPSSSWQFGSGLIRTLASKSESLIDNYYKDFQEFSSGLRKETSVIREVASRAVQDLPGRLESGAAIAQESLEAVGQAIDDVGSTVSEIISKDLNFSGLNESGDNSGSSSGYVDRDLRCSGDAKPYSRLEAVIRGVQCDVRTYCDEVEENSYNDWKMGFRVEDKREEIEQLMEENGAVKETYDELVPGKVDSDTFWCRYFYRVDKVVKVEEARLRIVKRAISGENEEELSWDVDDINDDDDDERIDKPIGDLPKSGVWEEGKGVESLQVENVNSKGKQRADEDATVSGTKSDGNVDGENLEERMTNGKEGSDGKIGSDVSIISSQRSSHAEDDIGWDQMEDIRSGDEVKVGEGGSLSSHSTIDPRKNTAEDDEILIWDVEDDN